MADLIIRAKDGSMSRCSLDEADIEDALREDDIDPVAPTVFAKPKITLVALKPEDIRKPLQVDRK